MISERVLLSYQIGLPSSVFDLQLFVAILHE